MAVAHRSLGLAYHKSGRLKEAIRSYRRALDLRPDDAEVSNNLGVAYAESGWYKEACESYRQAIRHRPDYTAAHYNLGAAYLVLNKKREALEQYSALKTLNAGLANHLFEAIYEDRLLKAIHK
jgi:Flp pilus assembly protein TadD